MRKGEPLCATDSSHVTVSGPGRSLVMPLRPYCSLPEKGPQAPYLLPGGGGWVWVCLGGGLSRRGWGGLGCGMHQCVLAGAPSRPISWSVDPGSRVSIHTNRWYIRSIGQNHVHSRTHRCCRTGCGAPARRPRRGAWGRPSGHAPTPAARKAGRRRRH